MKYIEYRVNSKIKPEELNSIIELVGWKGRSREEWLKILELSSFHVSAWCGSHLVGFGRIFEDGVMCMIYDVMVDPNFQNRKIGTTIMKYIMEELRNHNFHTTGLFAWNKKPELRKFYKKFGFIEVSHGMQLKDK